MHVAGDGICTLIILCRGDIGVKSELKRTGAKLLIPKNQFPLTFEKYNKHLKSLISGSGRNLFGEDQKSEILKKCSSSSNKTFITYGGE